jgi:hypothetical protein
MIEATQGIRLGFCGPVTLDSVMDRKGYEGECARVGTISETDVRI